MRIEDFAAALDPEEMLPGILATLERLVAFDTVRAPSEPGMPFGRASAEALQWFLKLAESEGLTAVNCDNYCGYVEYGEGEEMFAVACHLDVVPTGDPADWTTPPFEMTLRDGAVFGRGCEDDKGPLAVVYQLMRELKKRDVKLKRRMRLIVGCGEETGSSCLNYYRTHYEAPCCGITPDASYPVICGECGIMHFALERYYAPGENRLKLHAGVVVNAVPGRADAELDGERFSAVGRAAHASHPEKGDNALVKLCRELDGKVDSDFVKLVLKIDRKTLDLELEDEHSSLTLVPSLAEVDEKHARLCCDIRFPVTVRTLDIGKRLQAAFAGSPYVLTVEVVEEPLYFSPDSPFISGLLRAYSETTGDAGAKALVIGGGTYAKHLPNTVAFGCGVPGKISSAHEVDEHWECEDILLNTRILARALCVLDSSD